MWINFFILVGLSGSWDKLRLKPRVILSLIYTCKLQLSLTPRLFFGETSMKMIRKLVLCSYCINECALSVLAETEDLIYTASKTDIYCYLQFIFTRVKLLALNQISFMLFNGIWIEYQPFQIISVTFRKAEDKNIVKVEPTIFGPCYPLIII